MRYPLFAELTLVHVLLLLPVALHLGEQRLHFGVLGTSMLFYCWLASVRLAIFVTVFPRYAGM